MITITIKGIPKETHRALKKRATANRRSLNNEIIFTLESYCQTPDFSVRIPQSVRKTVRQK